MYSQFSRLAAGRFLTTLRQRAARGPAKLERASIQVRISRLEKELGNEKISWRFCSLQEIHFV